MEILFHILIGLLFQVGYSNQQYICPGPADKPSVINLSELYQALLNGNFAKIPATPPIAAIPQYIMNRNQPPVCLTPCNTCRQVCTCPQGQISDGIYCSRPCYDPFRDLCKKLNRLDKRLGQLCGGGESGTPARLKLQPTEEESVKYERMRALPHSEKFENEEYVDEVSSIEESFKSHPKRRRKQKYERRSEKEHRRNKDFGSEETDHLTAELLDVDQNKGYKEEESEEDPRIEDTNITQKRRKRPSKQRESRKSLAEEYDTEDREMLFVNDDLGTHAQNVYDESIDEKHKGIRNRHRRTRRKRNRRPRRKTRRRSKWPIMDLQDEEHPHNHVIDEEEDKLPTEEDSVNINEHKRQRRRRKHSSNREFYTPFKDESKTDKRAERKNEQPSRRNRKPKIKEVRDRSRPVEDDQIEDEHQNARDKEEKEVVNVKQKKQDDTEKSITETNEDGGDKTQILIDTKTSSPRNAEDQTYDERRKIGRENEEEVQPHNDNGEVKRQDATERKQDDPVESIKDDKALDDEKDKTLIEKLPKEKQVIEKNEDHKTNKQSESESEKTLGLAVDTPQIFARDAIYSNCEKDEVKDKRSKTDATKEEGVQLYNDAQKKSEEQRQDAIKKKESEIGNYTKDDKVLEEGIGGTSPEKIPNDKRDIEQNEDRKENKQSNSDSENTLGNAVEISQILLIGDKSYSSYEGGEVKDEKILMDRENEEVQLYNNAQDNPENQRKEASEVTKDDTGNSAKNYKVIEICSGGISQEKLPNEKRDIENDEECGENEQSNSDDEEPLSISGEIPLMLKSGDESYSHNNDDEVTDEKRKVDDENEEEVQPNNDAQVNPEDQRKVESERKQNDVGTSNKYGKVLGRGILLEDLPKEQQVFEKEEDRKENEQSNVESENTLSLDVELPQIFVSGDESYHNSEHKVMNDKRKKNSEKEGEIQPYNDAQENPEEQIRDSSERKLDKIGISTKDEEVLEGNLPREKEVAEKNEIGKENELNLSYANTLSQKYGYTPEKNDNNYTNQSKAVGVYNIYRENEKEKDFLKETITDVLEGEKIKILDDREISHPVYEENQTQRNIEVDKKGHLPLLKYKETDYSEEDKSHILANGVESDLNDDETKGKRRKVYGGKEEGETILYNESQDNLEEQMQDPSEGIQDDLDSSIKDALEVDVNGIFLKKIPMKNLTTEKYEDQIGDGQLDSGIDDHLSITENGTNTSSKHSTSSINRETGKKKYFMRESITDVLDGDNIKISGDRDTSRIINENNQTNNKWRNIEVGIEDDVLKESNLSKGCKSHILGSGDGYHSNDKKDKDEQRNVDGEKEIEAQPYKDTQDNPGMERLEVDLRKSNPNEEYKSIKNKTNLENDVDRISFEKITKEILVTEQDEGQKENDKLHDGSEIDLSGDNELSEKDEYNLEEREINYTNKSGKDSIYHINSEMEKENDLIKKTKTNIKGNSGIDVGSYSNGEEDKVKNEWKHTENKEEEEEVQPYDKSQDTSNKQKALRERKQDDRDNSTKDAVSLKKVPNKELFMDQEEDQKERRQYNNGSEIYLTTTDKISENDYNRKEREENNLNKLNNDSLYGTKREREKEYDPLEETISDILVEDKTQILEGSEALCPTVEDNQNKDEQRNIEDKKVDAISLDVDAISLEKLSMEKHVKGQNEDQQVNGPSKSGGEMYLTITDELSENDDYDQEERNENYPLEVLEGHKTKILEGPEASRPTNEDNQNKYEECNIEAKQKNHASLIKDKEMDYSESDKSRVLESGDESYSSGKHDKVNNSGRIIVSERNEEIQPYDAAQDEPEEQRLDPRESTQDDLGNSTKDYEALEEYVPVDTISNVPKEKHDTEKDEDQKENGQSISGIELSLTNPEEREEHDTNNSSKYSEDGSEREKYIDYYSYTGKKIDSIQEAKKNTLEVDKIQVLGDPKASHPTNEENQNKNKHSNIENEKKDDVALLKDKGTGYSESNKSQILRSDDRSYSIGDNDRVKNEWENIENEKEEKDLQPDDEVQNNLEEQGQYPRGKIQDLSYSNKDDKDLEEDIDIISSGKVLKDIQGIEQDKDPKDNEESNDGSEIPLGDADKISQNDDLKWEERDGSGLNKSSTDSVYTIHKEIKKKNDPLKATITNVLDGDKIKMLEDSEAPRPIYVDNENQDEHRNVIEKKKDAIVSLKEKETDYSDDDKSHILESDDGSYSNDKDDKVKNERKNVYENEASSIEESFKSHPKRRRKPKYDRGSEKARRRNKDFGSEELELLTTELLDVDQNKGYREEHSEETSRIDDTRIIQKRHKRPSKERVSRKSLAEEYDNEESEMLSVNDDLETHVQNVYDESIAEKHKGIRDRHRRTQRKRNRRRRRKARRRSKRPIIDLKDEEHPDNHVIDGEENKLPIEEESANISEHKKQRRRRKHRSNREYYSHFKDESKTDERDKRKKILYEQPSRTNSKPKIKGGRDRSHPVEDDRIEDEQQNAIELNSGIDVESHSNGDVFVDAISVKKEPKKELVMDQEEDQKERRQSNIGRELSLTNPEERKDHDTKTSSQFSEHGSDREKEIDYYSYIGKESDFIQEAKTDTSEVDKIQILGDPEASRPTTEDNQNMKKHRNIENEKKDNFALLKDKGTGYSESNKSQILRSDDMSYSIDENDRVKNKRKNIGNGKEEKDLQPDNEVQTNLEEQGQYPREKIQTDLSNSNKNDKVLEEDIAIISPGKVLKDIQGIEHYKDQKGSEPSYGGSEIPLGDADNISQNDDWKREEREGNNLNKSSTDSVYTIDKEIEKQNDPLKATRANVLEGDNEQILGDPETSRPIYVDNENQDEHRNVLERKEDDILLLTEKEIDYSEGDKLHILENDDMSYSNGKDDEVKNEGKNISNEGEEGIQSNDEAQDSPEQQRLHPRERIQDYISNSSKDNEDDDAISFEKISKIKQVTEQDDKENSQSNSGNALSVTITDEISENDDYDPDVREGDDPNKFSKDSKYDIDRELKKQKDAIQETETDLLEGFKKPISGDPEASRPTDENTQNNNEQRITEDEIEKNVNSNNEIQEQLEKQKVPELEYDPTERKQNDTRPFIEDYKAPGEGIGIITPEELLNEKEILINENQAILIDFDHQKSVTKPMKISSEKRIVTIDSIDNSTTKATKELPGSNLNEDYTAEIVQLQAEELETHEGNHTSKPDGVNLDTNYSGKEREFPPKFMWQLNDNPLSIEDEGEDRSQNLSSKVEDLSKEIELDKNKKLNIEDELNYGFSEPSVLSSEANHLEGPGLNEIKKASSTVDGKLRDNFRVTDTSILASQHSDQGKSASREMGRASVSPLIYILSVSFSIVTLILACNVIAKTLPKT